MAKLGPLSGQKLAGKYLVADMIDNSRVGAIYKALDTQLNRPVAIMVMSLQGSASERLEKMWRQGMGRMYESFSEAGKLFFVMEYIEGEILAQVDRQGEVWSKGEFQILSILTLWLGPFIGIPSIIMYSRRRKRAYNSKDRQVLRTIIVMLYIAIAFWSICVIIGVVLGLAQAH